MAFLLRCSHTSPLVGLVLILTSACGSSDPDALFGPASQGSGGAAAPTPTTGTPPYSSGGTTGTTGPSDAGAPGTSDAGAPPPPAAGGSSGQVPSAGPSCQGLCGSSTPDQSCWCDAECSKYGDCCGDFDPVCTSGCTPAHCGSDAPAWQQSTAACYCDADCVGFGDCCVNKPAVCGS
ncbi:MAG: hypothetical protein KF718_30615 [Polyangiaceae bacterium]|nr:hypothetical protein [Polyangiaceae bacterium]